MRPGSEQSNCSASAIQTLESETLPGSGTNISAELPDVTQGNLNRVRYPDLSGNVGYDKKFMTMQTGLEELTEKARRQGAEAAAQVKEATGGRS
jgi:hypothetical protein